MNEIFKNQQMKQMKVGLPSGNHSRNGSKCPNLKDRLRKSKARSPQPLQIHQATANEQAKADTSLMRCKKVDMLESGKGKVKRSVSPLSAESNEVYYKLKKDGPESSGVKPSMFLS